MEGPMALCGKDHKKLIARLNRIAGQVCGIRKMVENDRPCMDVLKQIAAVSGAVRGVGMLVLEDHLRGCVSDALRDNRKNAAMIGDVVAIFNKFAK
jgi:DNA-binding FrmR family transcriptional regulator